MVENRDDINKTIERFKARETASARIAKAGLPVPQKPQDAVDGVNLFTEWEQIKRKHGGIAKVPFEILGDFLDRWSQMLSYARYCEALADIDQATAREIRDTIKKQLYTLQEGGRELRDAKVHAEELYIEWELKYTQCLATYINIKALREGYEQRVNAVSREITRRGSDVIDTRRQINRGQTA